MKRTCLLAALCMIGLLMLPQTGSAKMVLMSDDQLSEVIGQAGFAEDTTASFNTHMDNMPVMGGIFNYSDVTMQGSVVTRNSTPPNTNMVNQFTNAGIPGFGMMGLGLMGLGSMGLGTHVVDMTINIDKLTIGAIRVGNDTTGPSLGDFALYGLHADIKGTVSVTVH
ncbi:MAG TPA: hypothetical protein VMU10_01085 [Desulfomonilia bacterium]|nr:hypothetical protein [Desulfomonilia bacterium]